VAWAVIAHPEVDKWLSTVDDSTNEQVRAAIDVLAAVGPTLGRTLVDRVEGSRHKNMKELRPGSSGRSEIRILFAFDPRRQAVLLVAGDKAGQWTEWYDESIPIADARFDEWLAEHQPERGTAQKKIKKRRKR
jgi:hypothetical protein